METNIPHNMEYNSDTGSRISMSSDSNCCLEGDKYFKAPDVSLTTCEYAQSHVQCGHFEFGESNHRLKGPVFCGHYVGYSSDGSSKTLTSAYIQRPNPSAMSCSHSLQQKSPHHWTPDQCLKPGRIVSVLTVLDYSFILKFVITCVCSWIHIFSMTAQLLPLLVKSIVFLGCKTFPSTNGWNRICLSSRKAQNTLMKPLIFLGYMTEYILARKWTTAIPFSTKAQRQDTSSRHFFNNEVSTTTCIDKTEQQQQQRCQRSTSVLTNYTISRLSLYLLFLCCVLGIHAPTANGEIAANIHAIIPEHFSMRSELSRELQSTVLNFKRDARNRAKLRNAFKISESLTFLADDTPLEILGAYCDKVLAEHSMVIFNINNPISIRRRISSNQYVLELASYLGIPVISWDAQFTGSQMGSSSRVLQLAPTLDHQAQAMVSLLDRYNWTAFSVVTSQVAGDKEFLESLEHLVELSKIRAMASPADNKKESLEILSVVQIRDLEKTKETLAILKGSDTRVILLHCSLKASYYILEAAVELGLTGKDFQWILTRSSIPAGKYAPSAFPVGLMGISFDHHVDAMKRAIRVGVKTWLRALLEMATHPKMLKEITIPPQFACNSTGDFYWKDGSVLYEYMRNVTIPDEPLIKFNENGTLKKTEVSIVNLQYTDGTKERTEWNEVGRWKRHGLIMRDITWPGESPVPPSGKPKRAFLKVGTLKEMPYVMYTMPKADNKCEEKALPCWIYERVNGSREPKSNVTVKRCCVGLCMDLLKILSERLNFDFTITEVKDGKWGALNNDTKKYNGLVEALITREFDLVMTSLKINPERAAGVRFSVPFLETGIKIIVSLRNGAISPTAFLEPFDFFSWMLIILLSVHVTAAAIFIFEWLVPKGISRAQKEKEKEPYDYASWSLILVFSVHATGSSILIFEWLSPYGLNRGLSSMRDHKFSLFRSFWLIWAMLFSTSVQTDTPKGIASRFLANIWALFALVFLASYTANLAAFMITKDDFYDLSGIQDYRLHNPHATNPPFKYATITDGSTEANIRTNYKKLHSYMTPYNVPSIDAGIEALKKGKIHAFIYDSSVLEYWAAKDEKCRLVTVGNRYAMTGYGVAFPPDFHNPWINKVNRELLKLQDNGDLDRLQKFWRSGACDMRKEKGVSNRTLGIINFTSAFILLGAGVLLGILILVFEHLYFMFGRKHLRKLDKCGCCALVSISMGRSLRMKDYVDEAMSLYTKNRCKDPICETQVWKLRHKLDMALLKIEKLETQLRIVNGETLKIQPSPSTSTEQPIIHERHIPSTENQLTPYQPPPPNYNTYHNYNPYNASTAPAQLEPTHHQRKQRPKPIPPQRYAVVNLPDVAFNNSPPLPPPPEPIQEIPSPDNLNGSFERFFDNFDKSPVSDVAEEFEIQLLPQDRQPLSYADDDNEETSRRRAGFATGTPSFSRGIVRGASANSADSSEGISCPTESSGRAGSPTPLLRRTPSYTSAVGGSLGSELSDANTPSPVVGGKFRQFDGKRYMGVDNNMQI